MEILLKNELCDCSLSSYGSSTNLTGTPINLYVEYNDVATGPLQHLYPNNNNIESTNRSYLQILCRPTDDNPDGSIRRVSRGVFVELI